MGSSRILYGSYRSKRLLGYDYSLAGYYYVTICTQGKRCYFGEVLHDKMYLNDTGQLVESFWLSLPTRYPGIALDHFVFMPNHMHGVIILPDEYPNQAQIEDKIVGPPSLGKIIRTFKAVSSYHVHTTIEQDFAWQRNFYDHVVRNETDLNRIRHYIDNNPVRWRLDSYYL